MQVLPTQRYNDANPPLLWRGRSRYPWLMQAPEKSQSAKDARRRDDLLLLAALSLFCASLAWTHDRDVFALVFAAFSAIASFHAAAGRPRS